MRNAFSRLLIACLGLVLGFAALAPAQAQVPFAPELRGGIFARDAFAPGGNLFDANRIRDFNAELLFSVPDLNAWTLAGELRPHLGATFNTDGGENLVYTGLSWTFRPPLLPVFAEVGGGAALHSASFSNAPSRFGCAVLAQGQASVGVEFLPRTALMATVQHATDFGLCNTPNSGMTSAGLRLGIRF